jgi:hypothetical protein
MPDTVTMIAPDGVARIVPVAERDKYAQAGGREAVKILDPAGTARWAPKDELSKYLGAGAKIATALPGASPTAASTPEARTPGNYAKEPIYGIGRGLKNDVLGFYQTLIHPIATVTGMRDQLKAADEAARKEFQDVGGGKQTIPANVASMLTFAENAPVIGGMVQYAEKGGTKPLSPEAVGAAFEGATTIEAPKIAGRAIAAGARALPETTGKFARAAAGAGLKTVKDLVKETKALNEKGAAATDVSNQTEAAKAEATRKGEIAKHASEAAKAASKNESVQQGLTKDLAAQRKIGPIQQKLSNARSALRASVETAREKALKVGNEKYSVVNEKLNQLPADMEAVHDAYQEASGAISDVQGEPRLLTRLGKSIQRGDALTYSDLQSLYSELGKELSKGTLPGSAYHAYDVLQEGVGNDMQRIADSQGQGATLTDARNYWRRMKQTFGKPISITDAATKAIGGVADETQANQIRLLGAFDPAIPRQVAHIANIERGVEAMPKPVPERVLTREAAAKHVAAPQLDVTPRPTPKTFEPQKIGPEEVAGAKAKGVEGRERQIEHKGYWLAIGPLFYTISDILKGDMPSLPGAAASVAAPLAVQAALTRMLTSPKVVDFLTKATPADIEQIPPEMRGNFPKILAEAQKRGIKVSPVLTKAFTGAAVAGTQNDSDQ